RLTASSIGASRTRRYVIECPDDGLRTTMSRSCTSTSNSVMGIGAQAGRALGSAIRRAVYRQRSARNLLICAKDLLFAVDARRHRPMHGTTCLSPDTSCAVLRCYGQ